MRLFILWAITLLMVTVPLVVFFIDTAVTHGWRTAWAIFAIFLIGVSIGVFLTGKYMDRGPKW